MGFLIRGHWLTGRYEGGERGREGEGGGREGGRGREGGGREGGEGVNGGKGRVRGGGGR